MPVEPTNRIPQTPPLRREEVHGQNPQKKKQQPRKEENEPGKDRRQEHKIDIKV